MASVVQDLNTGSAYEITLDAGPQRRREVVQATITYTSGDRHIRFRNYKLAETMSVVWRKAGEMFTILLCQVTVGFRFAQITSGPSKTAIA